KAMTSSTVSRESAPRSSTKEAVGVTSPSSTPSCSTMIVFTRSSTLAILIFPPVAAIYFAPLGVQRQGAPQDSLPILCKAECRVNLWQIYSCSVTNTTCLLVFTAREAHGSGILVHAQAAVDVEDLAGDVAGFVADEEDDGGGDVAVGAEAAERDHRLHFVF